MKGFYYGAGNYKIREFPFFSACGLNCGLCPRYHTDGTSKCPGCAGEGFSEKHPSCGVLTCCQKRDLEYCFDCEECPCKKYDGADSKDSFISHKNQFSDMDKAKSKGLENYKAELLSKMQILDELLEKHDDGRRKSFYCLAVNLLELEDLRAIMNKINNETEVKEVVSYFQEAAGSNNITLKLRRNF
jgi:hypothetical protein